MKRTELLNFFADPANEELFIETIEELDSYNGYLGDDRYYDMYMIDEFALGSNTSEVLERAYFGYDEDTSTENSKTEFNPMRDYFRFNGYGNLVSADYKDYSDKLDEWFIDDLIDNAYRLCLDEKVEEFIYKIQQSEKEEIEA